MVDYATLDHDERVKLLETLDREKREHSGGKILDGQRDLVRTLNAWLSFAHSFHSLLTRLETDAEAMIPLMNTHVDPDGRAATVLALDQAAIAYSAAVGAVVEQTRTFVRQQPDGVSQGYRERQEALIRETPGAIFLSKLRNYVLHYLALPWSFHGHFDNSEPKFRAEVRIVSDALSQFDGWGRVAASYISAQKEGVHLAPLIEDHTSRMRSVVEWLLEAIYPTNVASIDAYEALAREYNLVLTGGASDGSDAKERLDHIMDNLKRERRGEPQLDYRTGEVIDRALPADSPEG